MKIELFKKLIKDSMRELLIEEGIIVESKFNNNAKNNNRYLSEQFKPNHININTPVNTSNPIQNIMMNIMNDSDDLSNFQ